MPYDQRKSLKGLRFPFAVSVNSGRCESTENEDQIESCLRMLIATEKGSRPMLRDYGLGAKLLLQEPNDEVLQNLFRRLVFEEVARWEPRVTVNDVSFLVNEAELHIVLYYQVNETGADKASDFSFPRI